MTTGRGVQMMTMPILHHIGFVAVFFRQAFAAIEIMIRTGTPRCSVIRFRARRFAVTISLFTAIRIGYGMWMLFCRVVAWRLFVATAFSLTRAILREDQTCRGQ